MQYNELQTSRLENFARRLLGIRNGGVVPALSPEVGLELAVPGMADLLGLGGYIRWGFGILSAAVAGQYSGVWVTNRSSNLLVGVRWSSTPNVAGNVYLGTIDGTGPAYALANANDVSWLDTRRPAVSLPMNANGLEVKTGATAVAGPGFGAGAYAAGLVSSLAASPWEWPEIVLKPGTGCGIHFNAVNVALFGSAECWLREATAEELTI